MNAVNALGRLKGLKRPVVSTGDAAAALRMQRSATTRLLGRLVEAGLVRRLRHGLWLLDADLDPLALAEYLTRPFPAYVSLQSALFLRGMVSQVPQVIYVASLAQTRRVRTQLGTFSIHRLAPTFFGGYETIEPAGVRLAMPEKALLDTLYLGPTRSRLFAHIPELELPKAFDVEEAKRWVARIPKGPRRTSVSQRLERLLAASARTGSRRSSPGATRRERPRGRRTASRPSGRGGRSSG